MEKKLNTTQQKHTFTNQKTCTTTQKINTRNMWNLIAARVNGAGLFSKEKISKGG